MGVLVYSVVRRHMKRTSPGAFTVCGDVREMPVHVALRPSETVVGWYRNPAPWQQCLVIFTSESLYIVDDEKIYRIVVSDILGYEDPKSKKDVTGVRILTKDGFRFARVAGSFGPSGNQKDAYSFIMVLRALVQGDPVVTFDHGSPDRT